MMILAMECCDSDSDGPSLFLGARREFPPLSSGHRQAAELQQEMFHPPRAQLVAGAWMCQGQEWDSSEDKAGWDRGVEEKKKNN